MDKEQEGQEAGKKREEIGQNIHPHTVRVEGGASECCGSLHWQKPKFDYETSPRAEDGYSSSREGVRATAQRRHKEETLIGRGPQQ